MLGKYNRRTVSQTTGKIVGNATVQFFWQASGLPMTVYSDPDGNNALGSSVQSDADGRIAVFLPPGRYRIVVTLGGNLVEEITYEPIVNDLATSVVDDFALRLIEMQAPAQTSYIRTLNSGFSEFRTPAQMLQDLGLSLSVATYNSEIGVSQISTLDLSSFSYAVFPYHTSPLDTGGGIFLAVESGSPDGGIHFVDSSGNVFQRVDRSAKLSYFGGVPGSSIESLSDVSDAWNLCAQYAASHSRTFICDLNNISTSFGVTISQNGIQSFDGMGNTIFFDGNLGEAFLRSDTVDGISGGSSLGFLGRFKLRPSKSGLIAIDGRRLRDYEFESIDIRGFLGYQWSFGIDLNHSWSCKFKKVSVRNCEVAFRTGGQWNANSFWGCKLAASDVGIEIQSATGCSMYGCELEDNDIHINVTGFFGTFYFNGYMERGRIPLNIESPNIDVAKMVISGVVSSPNNIMETFCRGDFASGTLRLKMDNIEFRNDLPTSGYFIQRLNGNYQLEWDNVAIAGISPATNYALFPLISGFTANDWRRLKTEQLLIAVALESGYSLASSTSLLGIYKEREGWVRMSGTVNASALATDALATIPADLAPSNLRKYVLIGHSSAAASYTAANANLVVNGPSVYIRTASGVYEGRYSIDASWAIG